MKHLTTHLAIGIAIAFIGISQPLSAGEQEAMTSCGPWVALMPDLVARSLALNSPKPRPL